MDAKKCNLEDFRGKIALWLDAQHIRKISLIGKNRLSVLFMDNITDEFELEGCGAGDIESFLKEMKKKGIIVVTTQVQSSRVHGSRLESDED